MMWLPTEYRVQYLALGGEEERGKAILALQRSGVVIFIKLQLRMTHELHCDVNRDSIDDIPTKLAKFCGPHVY